MSNVCVNCGATENLQKHHIVPQKLGGTDNPSNLVLLCGECHAKAHQLVHTGWKNGGRPKAPAPSGYEEVLQSYFAKQISRKELINQLKLRNHRITEYWWYKEYVEKINDPQNIIGTELQVEVPMRESWQTRKYVEWRVKLLLNSRNSD